MNYRNTPLFVLLFTVVFLISCRTQKEATESKMVELKHWMTLEKFPCFGHCQVFKISLYKNGLAILEGREYLEKTGVFFTELKSDKMLKLKRMSEDLNLSGYQNEYMVNIADLPITQLQFFDNHGAKIKDVKANSNLPDGLHYMSKTVSDLIQSEKWTQVQKKPDLVNPEIISNELIVDMDSSLTKEMIETDFKMYDVKALQKISAYMNLWTFRFNEEKIGRYEMLIIMRKKNGIRSVNFNRKILPRE